MLYSPPTLTCLFYVKSKRDLETCFFDRVTVIEMTLALSLIISRGMLENMRTIISSSQMGDIYIENFNQTILQRLFGVGFGGSWAVSYLAGPTPPQTLLKLPASCVYIIVIWSSFETWARQLRSYLFSRVTLGRPSSRGQHLFPRRLVLNNMLVLHTGNVRQIQNEANLHIAKNSL